MKSPVSPRAMGASWVDMGDSIGLSWLEPKSSELEKTKIQFSVYKKGKWGPITTIHQGRNVLVNWADFPSVVHSKEGMLRAVWTEYRPDGRGAVIYQATSDNLGNTWSRKRRLSNNSPVEKGFPSLTSGNLEASFWLQSKDQNHSEMKLMASSGLEKAPKAIDKRVCDCCSLSSVSTPNSPMVFYRNRSKNEIRDVQVIRKTKKGWEDPKTIYPDNWKIEGCPVNGPQADTFESTVAVTWFTGSDRQNRVFISFSKDEGDSFLHPIQISENNTLGRVDMELIDKKTALVTWVESKKNGAFGLFISKVSVGGILSKKLLLATVSPSRQTGFPRLLHSHKMGTYIAWTNAAKEGVELLKINSEKIPGKAPEKLKLYKTHNPIKEFPKGYSIQKLDGNVVSLKPTKQKLILLNFWALWCPTCLQEMPELEKIHQTYRNQGLRVLAVNLDEASAREDVRRYIQKNGCSFFVGLDPANRAIATFGFSSLPATYLINSQGLIVWQALSKPIKLTKDLKSLISAELKKTPTPEGGASHQ